MQSGVLPSRCHPPGDSQGYMAVCRTMAPSQPGRAVEASRDEAGRPVQKEVHPRKETRAENRSRGRGTRPRRAARSPRRGEGPAAWPRRTGRLRHRGPESPGSGRPAAILDRRRPHEGGIRGRCRPVPGLQRRRPFDKPGQHRSPHAFAGPAPPQPRNSPLPRPRIGPGSAITERLDFRGIHRNDSLDTFDAAVGGTRAARNSHVFPATGRVNMRGRPVMSSLTDTQATRHQR